MEENNKKNKIENRYREIYDISRKLFKDLSDNQRKKLIFQLLNYLKVGNLQRAKNEVLRILNTIDTPVEEKNKFIENWKEVCYSNNDKQFEEMLYALVTGLLRIE